MSCRHGTNILSSTVVLATSHTVYGAAGEHALL
jgi:hypothetical protein